MLSLSDYSTLCEFKHPVNPDAVEAALRDFLIQLKVEPVSVKQYNSFSAAMAARAAWDVRAVLAALAAWAAWAAMAARDVRAARDARAAWAARAARAASDAWAASDAMAARAARAARATRAAWDAMAARDASYHAASGMVAWENQETWEPIARAFAAGCWQFWFEDDAIGWLPIPIVHVNARNQPHCEIGQAIILPNDGLWFLNGVLVSQDLVETPAEKLNPRLLLKATNAEVRREIVRKIGIERVCAALATKILDKSGEYELLSLDLGDGRSRPYLKMRNPSIGVYHIEGVAPHITTVRQAINWRAGNDQEEWTPEVLT